MDFTKEYPLQKSITSLVVGLGTLFLGLSVVIGVLASGERLAFDDPLLLLLSVWLLLSHEIIWNKISSKNIQVSISFLGYLVILYCAVYGIYLIGGLITT